MIKKILKIVLIVLVLAALAAAEFWFVWKKGLPLWVAAVIFAGIIGLFVGSLFLKKYLLRRREKKFVQRVVQLDESTIKGAPLHERRELQDLQEHWKESVDLLKRSSLKRYGNPLYTLPWYLVIGESGSGKTTAIRNARLESPVAYPDRAATISATLNCDWWFFENSIVLDTAGRYSIPLDETPDREEWEKFLTLLAKYRRREPINGVVATIPADKLLGSNRNILREDGQNIRKRIDQLMRVVGARFPVYILVTKMDTVYGFNDTFEDLSVEDSSQAMGCINKDGKAYWDTLLENAFGSVADRILELSLTAVRGKETAKPGAIVFRNEFLRLKAPFIEFLRAVFGDNPYQETPFLRGIFFSSGRQTGAPSSEFLERAGITPAGADAHGPEKGVFLSDIFARVLPQDRSLYTHTHDFLRWRRITRSLAFTSWLCLWAAIIGLLTLSFWYSIGTLQRFTDVFATLPQLPGTVAENLMTIEKFRLEIEELEWDNTRWFLPSFGLTARRSVEERAKERYVAFVKKGFLADFDRVFGNKLDAVNRDTDPDTIAIYANCLVTRVELLAGMVEKGKLPEIKTFTQAAGEAVDLIYDPIPYEISQTFGGIYRDYLRWHNNMADLMRSRELAQAGLVSLITRHGSLEWLVHKSIPDAPDIRLDDFWGAAEVGQHDDSVVLSGAYTKLGHKHITEFIKDLEEVLAEGSVLERMIPSFWKWYQEEYYKAWYDFADNFHKGGDAYQTETARRNMAVLMTTNHNPYWKFITRISDETIQPDPRTKPPKWTRLPAELIRIAELSVTEDDQADKKDQGLIGRIGKRLKKAETTGEQHLEEMDEEMKQISRQRPSRAKVYTEYVKTLAQIAPLATTGDTALRMVSDLFAGQAALAEDKSPFNMAFTQYLSLKSMMKEDNYGDSDFIWSLVGGPLNYLVSFGTAKTSCSLQDRWEGDVMAKMDGVPREKVLKSLFDKTDGVVIKYREGVAKPFLVDSKLGYTPRKAYEKTIFEVSIPFKPDFLKFLNASPTSPVEFQSDHSVAVQTVPIEVNNDAAVRPVGNVLSLQCSDGTAVLKNYNYPDARSFVWSPEKCGDTILKIMFPDFALTKVYRGRTGFPMFLSDFSSGSQTFRAADFPESRTALAKAGVKWIKVRYTIDNAQPVITALKKSSKKAPAVVTDCPLR
jgi:type VI secretion system protein ImpL